MTTSGGVPGPQQQPAAGLPTGRPRLRGVSHQIAFFVSLAAGPLLVLHAGPDSRWRVVVYAVSLSALLGVSALYHRITWTPGKRLLLRRLDHSMIFLLIAGTYTAIAGSAMPPPEGSLVLRVVWVGALAGIAVRLFVRQPPSALFVALYLILGWAAVLAWPRFGAFVAAVGPTGFALVAAGGVLYTIGAVIFATRRPDPVPHVFGYHEVFHALVVVAAVCHYAAVAIAVRPAA